LAYLHDPYNAKPEYFSRCESAVANSTQKIISLLKS
jgi:protein-tyrosine phosphatase